MKKLKSFTATPAHFKSALIMLLLIPLLSLSQKRSSKILEIEGIEYALFTEHETRTIAQWRIDLIRYEKELALANEQIQEADNLINDMQQLIDKMKVQVNWKGELLEVANNRINVLLERVEDAESQTGKLMFGNKFWKMTALTAVLVVIVETVVIFVL